MTKQNQNIEKINVYIKVNDYKITNVGEKYNNHISCIDNNDQKTTVSYDYDNNTLVRTNKDLTICIDFHAESIQYRLKQENKTAISNIKVIKSKKQGNLIEITYKHSDETFNLQINYT